MNYELWIVQGLLALLFLFAGGMKLMLPIEALTQQIPPPGLFLRFIAVCEVLGGIDLILPRTPAHSAGPDTAGRRRTGDHHDRCDGNVADDRSSCTVADPAGHGAAFGVRRIRPLEAGAASRVSSVVTRGALRRCIPLLEQEGWLRIREMLRSHL